jgi:hypothetical protein
MPPRSSREGAEILVVFGFLHLPRMEENKPLTSHFWRIYHDVYSSPA